MMKILILGAAGQVGQLLTKQLLTQTDAQLVLYAHHATTRLASLKRVIAASVLGIYGEVAGPFGQWNERMVGAGILAHKV